MSHQDQTPESCSHIRELLDQFVASAMAHGDATRKGDYKKGNREYRKLMTAVKKLRALGQLKALVDVLDHANPSVRCSAAAYLLESETARATRVLECIAKHEIGFVGFGAEMVLSEWRKGRLKMP